MPIRRRASPSAAVSSRCPRSSWSDYDPALISKGGGISSAPFRSIRSPSNQACVRVAATIDTCRADTRECARSGPVRFCGSGCIWHLRSRPSQIQPMPATGTTTHCASRKEVVARGRPARVPISASPTSRIEYALKAAASIPTDSDNSAGVDTSRPRRSISKSCSIAGRRGRVSIVPGVQASRRADRRCGCPLFGSATTSCSSRRSALPSGGLPRSRPQKKKCFRLMRGLDERSAVAVRSSSCRLRDAGGYAPMRASGFTRPSSRPAVLRQDDARKPSSCHPRCLTTPELSRPACSISRATLVRALSACIVQHRLLREIIATFVGQYRVNRAGITSPAECKEMRRRGAAIVGTCLLDQPRRFDLRPIWPLHRGPRQHVPRIFAIRPHLDVARIVEGDAWWLLCAPPGPRSSASCQPQPRERIGDQGEAARLPHTI